MKKKEKNAPVSETPDARQDDKSTNADRAAIYDAVIGSASDNVRSHTHHRDTLGNTGTNTSYEGATAPGSGGSVGTGNASGQGAVGAKTATNSEYEEGRAVHPQKDDKDYDGQEQERDII